MTAKMFRTIFLLTVFAICAISTTLAQGAPAEMPGPKLPASFNGVGYGQAGSLAGKTFNIAIYISDWTSNQTAQELAATLKDQGPDALLKKMEDMKEIGRVAPTGSTGSSIKVTRLHVMPDGGYRIILVTNRPISFGEVYNSTRSRDYPFGFVVLNLDKDFKGTGTLAGICKVKFNKKNELEIEHYGMKPAKLVEMRLNK